MNKPKITVAKTAGFCYGVERAVKIAYEAADKYDRIFSYGPLIHNSSVVNDLERRGVSVISDISMLQPGDAVIIRSHGVGKQVYDKLEKAGAVIVDATCPNVKHIHKLAEECAQNGTTLLVAGDINHPEVQGIFGYCRGNCHVFADSDELDGFLKKFLKNSQKTVAILSQTTYNIELWERCIQTAREYNNVRIYNTVCNATGKRQAEADRLSSECDTVIIIGGKNSSNTHKLVDICSKRARCFLVENSEELKNIDFSQTRFLGISAGASTPAYIIEEVQKTMTEILANEEEFNFAEAIEQTFKKIYTGKRVSGVVTAVNNTEVIVDIGTKHTGYIPSSELSNDPNAKPSDVVKVGDEIDVIVTKVNDVEGIATLSKKQIDAHKGFEEVKKAFDEGTVLTGVVTGVIKGGVIVVSGGMRVFVPASQSGVKVGGDLNTLLKSTVRFKVIEVDEQKKRAVGSIRKVTAEEIAAKKAQFFETAQVGDTVTGEVKSITDYGVFVDIGGVDGLIRRLDLTWARIKHPSEVVSVGETIEVVIKDIDKETGKVSLSYKKASENPWVIFQNNYSVGQTVEAKIVSVTGFGAFAQIIPGIDGLIHISQIANQRVNNVADFLTVGQTVEAKITECDIEAKRVSLSIRALLADNAEEAEEAPAEE